jgi:hypothetical protein
VIGGEDGADLGRQFAGEVEGLDQAGRAELPGVDAALERLDGGGRQAGEEFGALGFGDGWCLCLEMGFPTRSGGRNIN